MPSPAPIVEHSFRGPIHLRIEKHNRFLIENDGVGGWGVICAGTRAAHYLTFRPSAPNKPEWTQVEREALICTEKHLATSMLNRWVTSTLWPFARIVVIGNTDCDAFDFPTIGGL